MDKTWTNLHDNIHNPYAKSAKSVLIVGNHDVFQRFFYPEGYIAPKGYYHREVAVVGVVVVGVGVGVVAFMYQPITQQLITGSS